MRLLRQYKVSPRLRTSVQMALVGSALAALPAFAQPASEPAELRETVVTGTRLTQAEAEGSLSVTAVDPSQPANALYPTVSDVLRVKLPQYGGAGIINQGYGNGGNGASTVSLRGLPSNATLVLVNGRRTSTSDLNLIPEAAIEKIEILNDGAGAIYGSDAVAGVVNIILRKDFNGAKFDVRYGNTFENDISERRFSAVVGTSTETTRMLASAEYSAANTQFSIDRPRSRPEGDDISATSNPGTFTPSGAAGFGTHTVGALNVPNAYALRWSLVPGNTTGLVDPSQIPAGFNPVVFANTTSAQSSAEALAIRNALEESLNAALPANSPVRYGPSPSLLPGVDAGFPYGVYTYSYRPHERYGTSLSADHQLFGENLSVFMEGYYMHNESENALAPSPLSGRTLTPGNYWYNTVFGGMATNNLTVGYRPVELGPRITETDFESFHGVAGFKGRILESTWNWETSFLFDRTHYIERQTGGVLASVYDSLLAGTTAATAWNPFGYTPIGGSAVVNPQSMIDSLAGEATVEDVTSIIGGAINVNGEIIEIPGGALEIALGAEMRRESEDYIPDFAIQNGSVFPFNIQGPMIADRDVYSFYGELLIPIVDEDMDVPLVNSLSVNVAARYEDYDDVGDTGIKPRVNFRWEPLGTEITVRGSYAEGFSAPGFFDLYQLPGQDFLELLNPLTGSKIQPSDAVYTIGNPELKPSEAETWLIGAVYSPQWLKNFSIGGNYYRIEQTGIPFASAQYVVNQWAAAGADANPNNPYGANALPSPANPLGAQVILDEQGELQQINNVGPINTGERFTDGIDLLASQGFVTDIGTFTLAGQATRILTFEQENFPGAGKVRYLDRYFTTGAAMDNVGFPEWRANVTLSYEWERLTAAIAWNFVGGYDEDVSQGNYESDPEIRRVDDYITWDVRLGYRVPVVEVDLAVGINNILDEEPSLVQSSFEGNYDRSIGDIRGRMYFISASKTF